MKLAANLTLLYGHLPVAERFAVARADGFDAVEIQFPYDHPPEWYAQQLAQHALKLVLINTPLGAAAQAKGYAAQPDSVAAFQTGFEQAQAVCAACGCGAIHVMVGMRRGEFEYAAQRATLQDNLTWAQSRSPDVVLLLEALNRADSPGYFYHVPGAALEIVRALNTPRVRLQFDLYHAMREGLDLRAELAAALPWTHHVQVAGVPGRHEPDLSEPSLQQAFADLAAAGYAGYVGCEYRPRGLPSDGLGWRTFLIQQGWLQ